MNDSKTYWSCMDVLIIHHILVMALLERAGHYRIYIQIQGKKLMPGVVHNELNKKVRHCSSNSVVDDGVVNRHELACNKVFTKY